MLLISIELKIYDRTCPPSQEKEDRHKFEPNKPNHS
jgi:hypothetical protein